MPLESLENLGGRKEGTNKLVALKERGEYSCMVFAYVASISPLYLYLFLHVNSSLSCSILNFGIYIVLFIA